ncbi:MAG: GNAT family N-acetyltransferase [Firmicutes bacterium]|nr:GNAT family N-acetyltransferase [Bacillota bacterium]
MGQDKIIIQVTREDDLKNIMRLWNNGEVMQWVGYPDGLGITMTQLKEWLVRTVQPPQRCHYSIFLADGSYCGETFYRVAPDTGVAALDIKLLPTAQGRGIAYRALAFTINQAFQTGQAARVYVDPHPDNARAWRLYERLGFISRPRPRNLPEGTTYLEITREAWQTSKMKERVSTDFRVELKYKDIILRDYIASDIEDDIRWMTEETAWHEWDAPWEMQEDLKNFNPDDFRQKMYKQLQQYRSREILRTSFELCTTDGVHIGGCNSYLIDDNYNWIPRASGKQGHIAVGIDICESAYWSQGYGTMALTAFISYLLENGAPTVYTQTWSGNKRMIGLAQKLGFEICQLVPNKRRVRGKLYDGLTFKLNVDKFKTFLDRDHICQ